MTIKTWALLGLLALLACAKSASAAQSYDNCTGFITSLPAVISTQGTWCFKQDLATAISSGQVITIATNNVTIDCNNFKLGGLAAGVATQASGIFANNRQNVTIRNCSIRGFFAGVQLQGGTTSGNAIVDNRFDGNTCISIYVGGDGSLVQRNRVFDTGGSTMQTNAYGIYAVASVDVVDNTVSGVIATAAGDGSAYGIYTGDNFAGRILDNGVRGLVPDGSGAALGIDNVNSGRLVIAGNHVVDQTSSGTIGLACTILNSRAKDNVIDGFSVGISVCGDAGGNDITP